MMFLVSKPVGQKSKNNDIKTVPALFGGLLSVNTRVYLDVRGQFSFIILSSLYDKMVDRSLMISGERIPKPILA
jgi:hypothetical protein